MTQPTRQVRPVLTITPALPVPSTTAIEMEQSTLGSMLISTPAVHKVLAFDLQLSDWSVPAHRKIYSAILALHNRGTKIDTLSVISELEDAGTLDSIGGRPYIVALNESVPTAAHAEWYAKKVLDRAVCRALAELQGADHAPNHPNDPTAAIDEITARLHHLRSRCRASVPQGITAAELQRKEFPAIRWAVEELIAEGCSIFVGPEKSGKSFLALNLAIAVSSGGHALGKIPVTAGPVLHLALEDGERRIKRRMAELLGDAPWPEQLHLFGEWPRMDQGGYSQLDAWLTAHPGTRLVNIDLLARVRAPGTKNGDRYAEDYHAVAQFKTLADKHHCAIVLLHHSNRGKSDDFVDAVSGTRGLGGAADATIVLKRNRIQNSGKLTLTGRDIEEQELALTFDVHAGGWVLQGDAAEHALSEARQAIVRALTEARKPLGPKQVAIWLGKDDPRDINAVNQLLLKMSMAGQVITEGGKYSLSLSDQSSQSAQYDQTSQTSQFSTTSYNTDSRQRESQSTNQTEDTLFNPVPATNSPNSTVALIGLTGLTPDLQPSADPQVDTSRRERLLGALLDLGYPPRQYDDWRIDTPEDWCKAIALSTDDWLTYFESEFLSGANRNHCEATSHA